MKRTVIAVIMAAVVMIAAVIPVGAEEVSVNSCTAWYIPSSNPSGSFISPGSSTFSSIYYGWLLNMPIEQNYDYVITIEWGTDFNNSQVPLTELYKFTIVNSTVSIDKITDAVFNNTNSSGVNYVDLVDSTFTRTSGSVIKSVALSFSTAENMIDNITSGQKKVFPVYKTDTSYSNQAPYSINVYATKSENVSQDTAVLEKLDQIINNQNEWELIFTTEITEINNHVSNIDQNITNIYTYGNTYEVPKGGADLASSQEKLSGAEKAVSDKSTALKDSVSSQWSGNKTTAMNFISTITPATAAVTTVLADITAVMPAELQAALVAIPMILFIGWLIGRLD